MILNKQTILIVDDSPEQIDIMNGILAETYRVKVALNGKKALQILHINSNIDLILLDVMMPEMDGYQVCQHIKENELTKNIPIIFITGMNFEEEEAKGFELGAVDYITKPINPLITKRRLQTHLSTSKQNRQLEEEVQKKTVELYNTHLNSIERLIRVVNYKDNETALHIKRMSHYSRLIAESINKGINTEWPNLIYKASVLHDIGKIGITDDILKKPEKLNTDEFEIMKTHPEIGAEIIGEDDSSLFRIVRNIVLYHHEKFDGSGYPYGLKGTNIPLEARIVSIADVFDALTTKRVYKKAWSVEYTLRVIKEKSGVDFDPMLVEHFEKVLPEVLKIQEKFKEMDIDDRI